MTVFAIVFAVDAGSAGLARPAQAQPPRGSDYKSQLLQVNALLDGQHSHVTAKALASIGPLVPAILSREAWSSSATHRSRGALSLLRHFPDQGAAVLCAIARKSADVPSRRIAIRGCAVADRKVFGSVTKKLLSAPNAYVREATVHALCKLCDVPAKAALVEHRRIEKERFVRQLIDRVAPRTGSSAGAWRCRPRQAR